MNRDLGSRKCRLGLLEFRLVFHFVIIATDTGDEEGFNLFRTVLKTKVIQNRTINIAIAYPGAHASRPGKMSRRHSQNVPG